MRQWFAMISFNPNLYTGGDLSIYEYATIQITLPPGTYRFMAAVTTIDTDGTDCLVSFYTANDQNASSGYHYILRSTSGELHHVDFVTTKQTVRIYIYAGYNYKTSVKDTATYKNIQIIRLA